MLREILIINRQIRNVQYIYQYYKILRLFVDNTVVRRDRKMTQFSSHDRYKTSYDECRVIEKPYRSF